MENNESNLDCSLLVNQTWFQSLVGGTIELGWLHRPDHFNVGLRICLNGFEPFFIYTSAFRFRVSSVPERIDNVSITPLESSDKSCPQKWRIEWSGARNFGFVESEFFRRTSESKLFQMGNRVIVGHDLYAAAKANLKLLLGEFTPVNSSDTIRSNRIPDRFQFFAYVPSNRSLVAIENTELRYDEYVGVTIFEGVCFISAEFPDEWWVLSGVIIEPSSSGRSELAANDGAFRMEFESCRSIGAKPDIDEMITQILSL